MSNERFDTLDLSDFTGAQSGANWNQSFLPGESTLGTGRSIDSRAVVDRNGGITFGDPAGYSEDSVMGLRNGPTSYRRATAPEQIAVMPTPVPAPEQITVMPTPVPAPEQITVMPTPVPAPEQIAVMPTPVPAPEQITVMPTPVSAPEQITVMPTPAPEQISIAPLAVAPSFASPETRFATPGPRNAIAPRNDSDHVHAPRPVNSARSVTRMATPSLTGSADNVAGRAGEARKVRGRSDSYVSPTDIEYVPGLKDRKAPSDSYVSPTDTEYVPGLKDRKARSDSYVSPTDTEYVPGLKDRKVRSDSYVSPTDTEYVPGLKDRKVRSDGYVSPAATEYVPGLKNRNLRTAEGASRNDAGPLSTSEGMTNAILRELQTLTPEQLGRLIKGLRTLTSGAHSEAAAAIAPTHLNGYGRKVRQIN